MGTDIHLTVEKRNWGPLPDGYMYVGEPRPGSWGLVYGCDVDGLASAFREAAAAATKEGRRLWAERAAELGNTPHFLYGDRNYDTFAVLADVRNGEGFAGCDTGDAVEPISEPRGVPDDASFTLVSYDAEGGLGDHSKSWLTLGELAAHDWRQERVQRGYVDLKEYGEWLAGGRKGGPSGWCGGVGGVRTLAWPDLKRRRFPSVERLTRDGIQYVQLEWRETQARAAGDFYTNALPRLVRLALGLGPGEPIGPDDPLPAIDTKKAAGVRIVFGFDS